MAGTGKKIAVGAGNFAGGIGYAGIFGQGMGTAISEGTFGTTRKGRRADALQGFLEEQAASQGAESDRIRAELEAQGRPEMQAQVLRQQEIAAMAQRSAQEGMPTAQYENAQQNIEQGAAQALGGATSLGGGLRALGGIQSSTAGQYRQLNVQDAAMAQQNQGRYMNALGALGAAEGNAEQYNTIMPYEQKVAEMQALKAGSMGMEYQSLYFPYQRAAQNQQAALDFTGQALGSAGQIAAVASDIRLKEDIQQVGQSESGIPIYEWTYKQDPDKDRYQGTMAQDLIGIGLEDAVTTADNGYYAVDYSKIDVDFKKL
jgi:hypothetical protein